MRPLFPNKPIQVIDIAEEQRIQREAEGLMELHDYIKAHPDAPVKDIAKFMPPIDSRAVSKAIQLLAMRKNQIQSEQKERGTWSAPENTKPDENSKKFVAVLNKKIEIGKLMNALGHMTAGLSGGYGEGHKMHFLEYVDKDGGKHPNISHFPFIILKVENSNKIRSLRNEAIKRGILFTDFTSTMTVGTSSDQLERTKNTPESELEYFGICLFGGALELKELTGKFSLFN
jgi:hypothetical protein